MYIPRDDVDVALAQHQELLERSRQYHDRVPPLRTQVTRFYKLLLAHAGRKLVAIGYQIHKKSGFAAEIPLLSLPYAIENRS